MKISSPDEIRTLVRETYGAVATAYTGCIAGAAPVAELERVIAQAGFTNVRVNVREASRVLVEAWSPGTGADQVVASASIEAIKPT